MWFILRFTWAKSDTDVHSCFLFLWQHQTTNVNTKLNKTLRCLDISKAMHCFFIVLELSYTSHWMTLPSETIDGGHAYFRNVICPVLTNLSILMVTLLRQSAQLKLLTYTCDYRLTVACVTFKCPSSSHVLQGHPQQLLQTTLPTHKLRAHTFLLAHLTQQVPTPQDRSTHLLRTQLATLTSSKRNSSHRTSFGWSMQTLPIQHKAWMNEVPWILTSSVCCSWTRNT